MTAAVTGTPLAVGSDAAVDIVLLALFPGLLALALYYRGLGRTPASRATLAELALGARPTPSQWVGFVIVLVCVVSLALHEQRSERPAVAVPDDAREALGAGVGARQT